MSGAFGFDDGLKGLFVVVEKEPLTPGCRSNEEIDANIDRLKVELDAVGAEMKAALLCRTPISDHFNA